MGTTSSFLDSNSAAGKAAEQHSRFFLWMRNRIPSTDWKVMSASEALTAPTNENINLNVRELTSVRITFFRRSRFALFLNHT